MSENSHQERRVYGASDDEGVLWSAFDGSDRHDS